MCLRYSLTRLTLVAFTEALIEAADATGDWTPGYNIALTRRMPVVIKCPKPRLEAMSFGIVVPARPPARKATIMGNARADTLLQRPTFRDAARHRRCLVPADGFYEWEKHGTARLPHYFTLRDRQPFFFAGLWEPANDPAGPASFCIVTTGPNALVQPIHDRMPVILGPNSGPVWLGDEPLDPAQLDRLCRPLPAEMMTGHRVDARVNNVHYEAPDCIAPIRAMFPG